MSNDLNDLPKTNAEIVELAKYTRDRAPDRKLPDTPQLFVGYLITHGFGRLRVRNVLASVWKEASDTVVLTGEDLHRATMIACDFKGRQSAISYLNGAVRELGLADESAALLMQEWDALHFPNQLPAPVRERALKRHRFAIGESDA
jgi:hypothetical protein